MSNKVYYKKGNQYVDSNGKAVMIVKGNQLTFTEYFDVGGGQYEPPAYSTDEVNTGKKWIDGKDIYEKTIHANDVTLTNNTVIDADIKSNVVDTLVSIIGTVLDNEGSLYECYVSSADRVVPVVNNNGVTLLISNVTVKGYDITVQYTKPTPVVSNTRKTTKRKDSEK